MCARAQEIRGLLERGGFSQGSFFFFLILPCALNYSLSPSFGHSCCHRLLVKRSSTLAPVDEDAASHMHSQQKHVCGKRPAEDNFHIVYRANADSCRAQTKQEKTMEALWFFLDAAITSLVTLMFIMSLVNVIGEEASAVAKTEWLLLPLTLYGRDFHKEWYCLD